MFWCRIRMNFMGTKTAFFLFCNKLHYFITRYICLRRWHWLIQVSWSSPFTVKSQDDWIRSWRCLTVCQLHAHGDGSKLINVIHFDLPIDSWTSWLPVAIEQVFILNPVLVCLAWCWLILYSLRPEVLWSCTAGSPKIWILLSICWWVHDSG